MQAAFTPSCSSPSKGYTRHVPIFIASMTRFVNVKIIFVRIRTKRPFLHISAMWIRIPSEFLVSLSLFFSLSLFLSFFLLLYLSLSLSLCYSNVFSFSVILSFSVFFSISLPIFHSLPSLAVYSFSVSVLVFYLISLWNSLSLCLWSLYFPKVWNSWISLWIIQSWIWPKVI